MRNVHDCETRPLHPDLANPKEPSRTGKTTDLPTTSDIRSTLGQHEDIGELACSRSGAQEDEVRGESEGGAASDNAVVLWQIRHKDADEDEA
jgi:hypothetical protein